MPCLSEEWIYAWRMTNYHKLYQYAIIASRPDKEIKTVRKKKKKKKTPQVPIVALFGSHKGEQNKLLTRSNV